ncbi:hypothetical protein B9Z55_012458 [Caenorhabditis nigoni]|nr:hypothetical protein B9Z55_012458 [Caenorhabditis nigoni]
MDNIEKFTFQMSHPLQTDGQKLKEYVQKLYRKRLSIREAHREVCSQISRDLRGEGEDTPRSSRASKQETPPPRPLHRTVSEDEEARISRMLADLNLAPKEVLPGPSVEFKSSEDQRNWCHDAPIPDGYQGPVHTSSEDLPGPSTKNRSFSDPSPAVPARLVEAVERDRSFSTTNSSSELLKRGAHFSKEEPSSGPNPKKPKIEGSRPIILVNMSETPLRPFRDDCVERGGTYDVYETFENGPNDQFPLTDIYGIYLDEMVDEMQGIERDETQMIQNSEDIFKLFFIRRMCTESSRVAGCLSLPIKSVAWTTGYRIIQLDLIDFNDSKIQIQYLWQPNGALVRYGDNEPVPVNGKEYEDVACCDFVYILKGVNLKLDWLAFYIEAYSPLHPGVFPNLDVFYLMRMFMTQVIAKKALEVSKFRFMLSRRFAFDPKIGHMFSYHHCMDWLQTWLQPVEGLSIWVWDDSEVSTTNKKFRPKSDSMERLQYEAIDLFMYPKISLWMEAKKIEIRDLIKINWNYFYHFEIVNLEKLDAWLVLHICEVLKKQIATQGCIVYLDENLDFEEIQQILAHFKFGEFSDEENPKMLKFVSEKHDYEVFVEFGDKEIQISVKEIPLELRPKPKPIPFKTTPRKFAHL